MNYAEYSKLRSIARKRVERLSAAGLGEYFQFPTVAQVRKSNFPEQYMEQVKNFLSEPTTVKATRQLGGRVEALRFSNVPEIKPLTPEEKRARRNMQKRRSKAKRAIEKAIADPKKARHSVGYLKALETLTSQWKEAGVDIGPLLSSLSPGKAKQFVDYMDYRFSQGDYTVKYVIDTFTRDFGELMAQGYNFDDIKHDFDVFVGQMKQLEKNKEHTNEYGVDSDEMMRYWKMFVKGGVYKHG